MHRIRSRHTVAISATTGATIPVAGLVEGGDAGLLGTDADVRAVAVGPLGLAVGEDRRQQGISEDDEAAVWVSGDGSVWRRVETDPSFVDGAMTDVVWYPPGEVFVAVGTHVSEGAVWHSADGPAWRGVALFTFSNPSGGIEVDSIVTLETGLHAFGGEVAGCGDLHRAQWTFADSTSWLGAGRSRRMTDASRLSGFPVASRHVSSGGSNPSETPPPDPRPAPPRQGRAGLPVLTGQSSLGRRASVRWCPSRHSLSLRSTVRIRELWQPSTRTWSAERSMRRPPPMTGFVSTPARAWTSAFSEIPTIDRQCGLTVRHSKLTWTSTSQTSRKASERFSRSVRSRPSRNPVLANGGCSWTRRVTRSASSRPSGDTLAIGTTTSGSWP